MRNSQPLSVCVHCSAPRSRVLGLCKICHTPVCTSCGTTQITQTEGTYHIHNECFDSHLDEVSSSFQFIKFVKPSDED